MDENKKDTGRYVVCVLVLLGIFAIFGVQLINRSEEHTSELQSPWN